MGTAELRPVKRQQYGPDDPRLRVARAYSDFMRALHTGPVYDIDAIHHTWCRVHPRTRDPLALIEQTAVPTVRQLHDLDYVKRILARLRDDGEDNSTGWISVLRKLGAPLGLTVAVVVLPFDFSAVGLYVVDGPRGWLKYQTPSEHARWLRELEDRKVAAA